MSYIVVPVAVGLTKDYMLFSLMMSVLYTAAVQWLLLVTIA